MNKRNWWRCQPLDEGRSKTFEAGLEELIKTARHERLSIMCAEAIPWRCHRSLIADALTVRGFPVEHILSVNRTEAHLLTPFARVDGKHITYSSAD